MAQCSRGSENFAHQSVEVAKSSFWISTNYIFRKLEKTPYVLQVRILQMAAGLFGSDLKIQET